MGHSGSSTGASTLAKDVRFVSVANRLALMIFALVASVSLVIALAIAGREHEYYLDAKRRAAEMLTELVAASAAPALDFADVDAIAGVIETLSQNAEVMDAAVWGADELRPLARLARRVEDPLPERLERHPPANDRHLDVVRAVHSPQGKPLGSVAVRLSLAREQQAIASARRRIFWLALGLSGLVAGLLIGVVRRMIVTPLGALERAARRLGRGELIHVADTRHDEVGSLGRTFNRMGLAIAEREERISAMNGRLQGLLDNMRQAILVFDEQGHLAVERSRLACHLFGNAAGPSTSVVELLFPAASAAEVERDAFRVWLAEAARVDRRDFDELAALAPREATLPGEGGEERLLELEFRLADAGAKRFMLLATDMTSQRKLERTAESQARQHEKQLTAMRRLLAGGGQVFVQFLASARERLERARQLLEETGQLTSDTLEHAFRFVHTLRAEARSFDLEQVEALASDLELGLSGARHAPLDSELRSNGARQLQGGFARLEQELQQAEQLFIQSSPIGRRVLDQVTVSRQDVTELFRRFGERRDALGKLAARLASRPFGELVSTLPDALQRWAGKDGKRVELSVQGREVLVPAPLCEQLGGVLAHLLRNAVAHGIEAPFQRKALGKPDTGRVQLECREEADGVSVEVADDGAGFDLAALRRSAAAGHAGAAAAGHAGAAELELAFIAGVSTREACDELAGHGVGLGAVREELARAGYVVRVRSQPGQGACLRLEPAPEPAPRRYESVRPLLETTHDP